MFEKDYDRTYASSIFSFSKKKLSLFYKNFPGGISGGTGTGDFKTLSAVGVPESFAGVDYSLYPEFENSIGFTQRGCRLKCKFCVVPKKEGKPKRVASIHDIYRGDPFPKNIHLLDNDFFGADGVDELIEEIKIGKFKVSFTQGINIRLVNEKIAEQLSRIKYYDDGFKCRRLYTAWDNINDEKVFFRGVDKLEKAGVPPRHITAYMLIGFAPDETVESRLLRFNKMKERGITVYPMAYAPPGEMPAKELKQFQRWAIRKYHEFIPFKDYRVTSKAINTSQLEIFND